MGRPLDEMDFYAIKRYGSWVDGVWVADLVLTTAPIDGDPVPTNVATVSSVNGFEVGDYAWFYKSGVELATVEIVSIDPIALTLTFAAGALTFDVDAGAVVVPYVKFKASRPQPAGAELIDFLDEGARSTARFVIYADDDQPALALVDEPDRSSDLIQYAGETYKVTSIDLWADMPLGYRSYILLAFGHDETPA